MTPDPGATAGTTPGWTREILTFAMDHRDSYRRLLGLQDPPVPAESDHARAIKSQVFDGFELAVEQLGPGGLAVLLDEEYGAPLAARAHDLGVLVCAPVERSGQVELDLEFGDALPRLVETLGADLFKVLLRYNAEGDPELNKRQAERVAEVSDWCLAHRVPLMGEILVPMTPAQREREAAHPGEWDGVRRPELTRIAIEELRAAGGDPSLWKIEGLDSVDEARSVAETARASGRDDVSCVVLGRGESLERVEDWVRVAAQVDGFVGLAVGRSLWNDEALGLHRGDLTPEQSRARIADKYLRVVSAWRG
jgi:myo-inositol catabolism protein IolC